ncbi:MAG TPA: hypothetical protein VLU25_14780 [Acidobacteriota bacterium]|nr:hypothetical protein [Acidobacteriota bacterium]
MQIGRSALGDAASSEGAQPRRFSFRLLDDSGPGDVASLQGRRTATLIRATSARAVLEVEGVRIELDGPLGGRPGKQVQVEIRPGDPPLLEVLSGGGGGGTSRRSSQTAAERTGAAAAPAVSEEREGGSVRLPARTILISQSLSAQGRTLLAGVQERGPFPLKSGESVPLRIIASDADHALLALRGRPLLLESGGLPAGRTLWAEVVSGPEYPVLRLQVAAAPAGGSGRASPLGAASAAGPEQSQRTALFSGAPPGSGESSADPVATQRTDSAHQILRAAAAQALQEAATQGLLRPGEFPRLPRGALVTARVIRAAGPGNHLLQAHGVRFLAQVPPGTQPGEDLLLQVEVSGSQTLLRVVDRVSDFHSAIAAILRQRLALKMPMGESWARLSSELKALPPQASLPQSVERLQGRLLELAGSGRPPSPSRLAAMIEEGGLQYESRLAQAVLAGRPDGLRQVAQSDLKALLLEVQAQTQASAEESLSRLAAGVARHLANIESSQAANLLSLSQSQGVQIELPLLLGSELTNLQLSLRSDRDAPQDGASGSGRGYHIVFLLQLQWLGQTRVDAYSAGQALRARLLIEREEPLQVLRRRLPQLGERLKQAGFEQVHLEADVLSEIPDSSPNSLDNLSQEEPAGPSLRLIDVRA